MPVFGILLSMILGSFTDFGGSEPPARTASAVQDRAPDSTSPPSDLVDALSFFTSLTEVQVDEIKDRYRGAVVQWTLPVWDVSKSGKEYVIQTSSDAPVSIFCRVTPTDDGQEDRIKRLRAGERITCKGEIKGFSFKSANVSPAVLVE